MYKEDLALNNLKLFICHKPDQIKPNTCSEILIGEVFHTLKNKYNNNYVQLTCPVDWGCRIHRLHLCRGVRPSPPQRMSWI